MPASPVDGTDATDAAREGAREGTAVGTSSVPPTTTGSSGRKKTGAGAEDVGGRFEEGEGAAARVSASLRGGRVSLIVLSANASISSVDDCVTRGGMGALKGSGEFRAE